ncbi:MAG: hypothetical protein ACPHRO_12695, partial [Nannocystaceae bacterium]
ETNGAAPVMQVQSARAGEAPTGAGERRSRIADGCPLVSDTTVGDTGWERTKLPPCAISTFMGPR